MLHHSTVCPQAPPMDLPAWGGPPTPSHSPIPARHDCTTTPDPTSFHPCHSCQSPLRSWPCGPLAPAAAARYPRHPPRLAQAGFLMSSDAQQQPPPPHSLFQPLTHSQGGAAYFSPLPPLLHLDQVEFVLPAESCVHLPLQPGPVVAEGPGVPAVPGGIQAEVVPPYQKEQAGALSGLAPNTSSHPFLGDIG